MKNRFTMIKVTLLIIISVLMFSCSDDNSSSSEIKINYNKLDEAFVNAGQIENLKSLVVSYDGAIIKQVYYNDGGADLPSDVRSVTKSVIGLLVGIAIEKGQIQSVEQPIGGYLTPLVTNISTEKANIKIKDLLTMSSGFGWEELNSASGYNNWANSANQVEYLINMPLIAQSGQVFTYNSAALHLLSVIISRSSNIKTIDFAKQYLFDPLEIGSRNWLVDKQGYNNGGAGLQITPIDMIKIGQLVLNKGEYKGKRIVPASWIDQLMTAKISTGDIMNFANGYGYCWWIGQSSKGNYAFANGYGGQFIVVVPNLKLVVVATNKWNGVETSTARTQWYQTMDLIITGVLGAFN
ncbi:MAG: serine hydrolase [bacterium]